MIERLHGAPLLWEMKKTPPELAAAASFFVDV
jgi:hypothetical protein